MHGTKEGNTWKDVVEDVWMKVCRGVELSCYAGTPAFLPRAFLSRPLLKLVFVSSD